MRERVVTVVLAIIAAGCSYYAASVVAQTAAPVPTPPSPKYALSCASDTDLSIHCAQYRRLYSKHQDAAVAKLQMDSMQQAFIQAQNNFYARLKDLQDEGDKIKHENGWDPKVQFNPNAPVESAFSEPPPEPKPAPAPPAKK